MNEAVLHSKHLIIELFLNYELCQVHNDVALILLVESQCIVLCTAYAHRHWPLSYPNTSTDKGPYNTLPALMKLLMKSFIL